VWSILQKLVSISLRFEFGGANGNSAASKNHNHSVNNPYSQFKDGWSVDQVLNAPKITKNLTKFMCSPTSVCHTPILSLLVIISVLIVFSLYLAL